MLRRYNAQRVIASLFFCAALISAGNVRGAGVLDPSLTWRTIPTEHFRVHYSDGLEEIARRAGAIAEDVHDELSAKLDWEPNLRTHLIVTDNSDFANGLTSVFPYPTILLFVAPPSSADSLDNYDNWLHMLLTHEYTHVLMLDMTGGIPAILRHIFGRAIQMNSITPSWWGEGVPTYEEMARTLLGRGRSAYVDMTLRAAILEGEFPSIGEAGDGRIKWPAGETPYIFGVAFVSYLAERFGEDKVHLFLKQYSRQAIPFRMGAASRKIFGHRLKNLWAEWEKSLRHKYGRQFSEIKAAGIVEGTPLTDRGFGIGSPTWSPRTGGAEKLLIYFYDFNPHNAPSMRVIDPGGGEEEELFKARAFGAIGASPGGDMLAYAKLAPVKGALSSRHYYYTDIYIRETDDSKKPFGKEWRLTEGERASDPDFSPDGKQVVYISRTAGGARLKVIDIEGKKAETLWNPGPAHMLDAPRWSPDGKYIALSVHKEGGYRDIYIIERATGKATPIVRDRARDVDPSWSPDGKYLLFSSDRTGIANIYVYSVEEEAFFMATNVVNGAFQPALSPDGGRLVYRGYSSKGFDLFVMPFNPDDFRPVDINVSEELVNNGYRAPAPLDTPDRRHNPLPSLAPRYMMPSFWFDGVDFQAGLSTGGLDPLREHQWAASARWGAASEFLSWGAAYSNDQLEPTISLSFQQYSVSYGEILLSMADFNNDGVVSIPAELFFLNKDYFEARSVGAIGVEQAVNLGGLPMELALSYTYEERNNITGLPKLVFDEFIPDEGVFSGFGVQMIVSQLKRYPYSISPEFGFWFRAGFDWLDQSVGSDFNQRIFTGDLRGYAPVPWFRHHVVAARVAGGFMEGNQLFQGTFRVGGTLGESVISSPPPTFLSLRGFETNRFIGDWAFIMSGEYRFPIAYPQKAPGLLPVYFQKVHGAFFADYGGAFDRKDRFLLSIDGQPLLDTNGRPVELGFSSKDDWNLGVGAELRVTGIIGWGLVGPAVTGRLGFAQDLQGDGIGPTVYFDLGAPF